MSGFRAYDDDNFESCNVEILLLTTTSGKNFDIGVVSPEHSGFMPHVDIPDPLWFSRVGHSAF